MDYYFALKFASKIEFWCEKVGSTSGCRPYDKNINMKVNTVTVVNLSQKHCALTETR